MSTKDERKINKDLIFYYIDVFYEERLKQLKLELQNPNQDQDQLYIIFLENFSKDIINILTTNFDIRRLDKDNQIIDEIINYYEDKIYEDFNKVFDIPDDVWVNFDRIQRNFFNKLQPPPFQQRFL